MKYHFSNLAKASITPSVVNQLTASFAEDFREGLDINLGVGYVNDKTIPTNAIQEAYTEIINDPIKYRNALNYGGPEGSPNLREAIKSYYLKYEIGDLQESDFVHRKILIGANGATSLLDAFSDLIQPGIVITADPYYYIYTETLENKGFKILGIPEDEEGLNTEALRTALSDIALHEISFFYIVTVNNPSTILLSNKRKQEIVDIAQEVSQITNKKIPVLFDKAYEDIIHNSAAIKPISGLKHDQFQQVFEVGTLSKILAPALRIGYMICPDNEFAQVMTQRTSDIGFSAPLINQEIAGWLLQNYIHQQKEQVNTGYQAKAKFIIKLLNQYLKPYINRFSGGDAAFYFYITFNNIRTDKSSDFFKYLSRTTGNPEIDGKNEKKARLIYIPGTICSKTDAAKYQLRLSYGFEEPEVFEKAVKMMAEACSYSLSLNAH